MNQNWNIRSLGVLIAVVVCSLVFAQSSEPMGDAARRALQNGQVAAAKAMAAYDEHYPDLPLWKEAIDHGIQARRLAPQRREPVRFLAQVYTTTQWHYRAWQAWQEYVTVGGELDVHAERQLLESGVWLGYDSYQSGDLERAREYFEGARALQPNDPQIVGWLGRVYFELGDPKAAVPLLQEAVRSMPSVAVFEAYLDRAEHQLAYGLAASNAYFEGAQALEEGRPLDAVESFRVAIQANPNFREAYVEAGEAYLDLGRPDAAIPYWEGAVAIEPNDQRARFFLTLARDQVQWGRVAALAFREGQAQVQAGNWQAAAAQFARAVQSNPQYAEAWAARGRAAAQLGNDEDAEAFYQSAVELAPGNAVYQSALQEVRESIAAAQRAPEPEPKPVPEPAPVVAEPEEPPPPPVAAEPEPAEPEPADPAPEADPLAEPTPPEAEPVAEPAPPEAEPVAEPAPPVEATPEPETAAIAPAERSPTDASALVLLDTTLTHSLGVDNSTSAFRFMEGQVDMLRDLTAPVDYATGTLVHRLEVLSKPSDRSVQYQLCLVPQNINSRPACAAQTGLQFSGPGVYEHRQALPSLSQYGEIDWVAGLSSLMVIVKDGEGNPVDGSYPLRENFVGAPDLGLYYPMQVRYTVVLVPDGGTFAGWQAVR